MSKKQDEANLEEKLKDEALPEDSDVKKEEQVQDEQNKTSENDVKTESDPEEEALNTRFMRLSADFANYKKRIEKEKSDIYRLANEKLMLDLLPVIDNFERAFEHADESPKEKFVEGVEMILKNFMTVLQNAGLKEIEAVGQPFDHNAHHAVLTEKSEEHEADTVTGVLQKGYTLNEKVIRPSMVKVSN